MPQGVDKFHSGHDFYDTTGVCPSWKIWYTDRDHFSELLTQREENPFPTAVNTIDFLSFALLSVSPTTSFRPRKKPHCFLYEGYRIQCRSVKLTPQGIKAKEAYSWAVYPELLTSNNHDCDLIFGLDCRQQSIPINFWLNQPQQHDHDIV